MRIVLTLVPEGPVPLRTRPARALLGLAAVGSILAVAACGGDSPSGEEGISIVASNSIVGDLVGNVAGDGARVTTLVGPDGDVHTFEPTPQDLAAVAEADVVIENGLGLETWMDDVLEGSGTDAPLIALADGVDPLPLDGEDGHEADGDVDPHVWQSVPNARAMVERARDALIEADPQDAASYRANADAYLERLDTLQEDVVAVLDRVPPAQRTLVTNHDTFAYFADEYGFEVLGDALASVTTAGGDPSASDVAAFVAEIEDAGVPAIFPENTADAALVETLAREAGVEVAPALYTDALGPEGSPGETYVGMIGYNASTIADALRERP